MTSRNEARTQVDPALLEQFMKQQEAKYTAPAPPVQNVSVYSVPTDFVELPSRGNFYPEGHPWHKKEKVEVKFMTTKEEDILTSPAYAKEGVTFDKLIESITLDRIDVGTLLIGDKNAVLINARKNAYGNKYDFFAICEECLEGHQLVSDLNSIEIKKFDNSSYSGGPNGTFTVELPQSKEVVQFRLFRGSDDEFLRKEEAVRRKHTLPFEKIITMHRLVIVSVNEHSEESYIDQFVQNMLIRDSKFLQKAYQETKPDVVFEYNFICKNCTHQNQGGVPFGADFFWPNE